MSKRYRRRPKNHMTVLAGRVVVFKFSDIGTLVMEADGQIYPEEMLPGDSKTRAEVLEAKKVLGIKN